MQGNVILHFMHEVISLLLIRNSFCNLFITASLRELNEFPSTNYVSIRNSLELPWYIEKSLWRLKSNYNGNRVE